MAAWSYTSVGGWVQDEPIEGSEDYSYSPAIPQFYHEEDGAEEEVDKTDVPQAVRNNLEYTADGLIDAVLDDAEELPITAPVAIGTTFNQGTIAQLIDLTDNGGTFGSTGATPCLIVFATAVKTSNNHLLATGSHLVDVASYNYSDGAIEDMIDTLENEGVGQISFYVVGGEVGCNTNPSPTLTMDYSRYYPFFDAASDQDVTFVGQNFPSNPDGTTTTSAAISANGQNVDFSLWTVPTD